MSYNFELLTRLVNEQESEYLDFKLKYHDNNANLIHDILCLANSLHNDEKYIIFGINNKRKIIGINKKSCPKQHDIIDLLRSVKLNKSVYNYITFEAVKYNLKTVGLLTIKNCQNIPFFILEDYRKKGTCVRAWMIYEKC